MLKASSKLELTLWRRSDSPGLIAVPEKVSPLYGQLPSNYVNFVLKEERVKNAV